MLLVDDVCQHDQKNLRLFVANPMKVVQTSTLSALSTGLFTGLIAVIISISYVSLIFSGELTPYLGHGIALAISSLVVVGLVQTIWSNSAHFVIQVDDDTAPVLVLLVGFLLASLPLGMSPEKILTNVFAAIIISTFVAGLVLIVVGYFKLGGLLQFLPYSAIGGYFAAVGWLLLVSTLTSLVPFKLDSIDSVQMLFSDATTVLQWLPALIIGAWLRWMSDRVNIGLLLGSTIVGTTLLFYGAALALGADLNQLQANGFMLGPLSNTPDNLFMPVSSIAWSEVEFSALSGNTASIATMSLIALLSFTLCISAVALSTRAELNPNKELRIGGLANMLSALAGGLFALPSISSSKLCHELHPRPNKLIGLASVGAALLVFYFGLDLLAYIPKMVLGVLLIYIAAGFLYEWLVKAYRKFGAVEYSVIPLILVVSVLSGFLESILFGIFASIVLFAINYSQIKVVKYQASGVQLRSNLVRRPEQISFLRLRGEKIRLFKLQGFLFFGTAGSLYKEVMTAFNEKSDLQLKYIVIDFSQVLGVDSSATLNFERLAQRLKEHNVFMVLTGLKPDLLDKLTRGGFDVENNDYLQEFLDIDQGLEWCENHLLNDNRIEASASKSVLELVIGDFSYSEPEQLEKYLVQRTVEKGEILTNFGEKSNDVFLLDTCTASAYILDSENRERRVDGAGQGAIYGEIGFFLNIPRTAIVRADSDGSLYTLSYASLKKMETEAPQLAAAINRYMLKIVSERLASTTQSLRTVL